jgi:predicted transcriptional regulator of viral defense system
VYRSRDSLHAVSTGTTVAPPAGISRENRALLERLHRELPSAFDAASASRVLDLEVIETRRLLGYLARRGWLSRVKRGLYIPVPLDARRSGQWVEDPWIIADRVFRPCYIGGWSACEHWSLTEQVFRTVLVVTAKKVREREPVIQGMPFRVTVRSNDKIFGTTPVWRNQVRVQVSDPTRTIIDILDDPTLGGGMRNGADVVHEYLNSEHRNDSLLIEYGDRMGNRALFKRLGYLLEQSEVHAVVLLDACRARRGSGLIALDPSIETKGTIVRRWGLRANVTLGEPGGDW